MAKDSSDHEPRSTSGEIEDPDIASDPNVAFAFASELVTRGAYDMAVRAASAAAAQYPERWQSQFSLAAILIDAGARSRDRGRIAAGVSLLEKLLPTLPASVEAIGRYNLGNGYLELGMLERGRGPLTRPSLAKAVSHLAASIAIEPRVEANINLASAFVEQGRYVEAIDLLTRVIEGAPEHPVAYATRARASEGMYRWMLPHRGLLATALLDAERAVEAAKRAAATDYETAYKRAAERLRTLTASPSVSPAEPAQTHAWIWQHGLGLNPCGLCGVETPDAFDSYVLEGKLRGGARRPSTAEVSEIVNTWHRTFSAARWTLLQASEVTARLPDDHVLTTVGLPDSRHDLRVGLLVQAITGFYSVFDKVAFGLNAYLHLGHRSREVSFARIWARRGKKQQHGTPPLPEARLDLHPAILKTAARPLAALYHLAWSLETGEGIYRALRDLRNEVEHRLVIVAPGRPESRYFRSVEPDEIERQAFALGRLAKAAMWYAGGTLWWLEARRVRRARHAGQVVDATRTDAVRRT